jgi:hypothetical protein
VLAQLYHLGFQVIDLRNLLAQLGELTFISLRSDLQEELMVEGRERLLHRRGCLLPFLIADAEAAEHGL